MSGLLCEDVKILYSEFPPLLYAFVPVEFQNEAVRI